MEEEARLRSLTNVLIAAGYDPTLFEDGLDLTFELLRNVGNALQTGNAEQTLLEAFNNEELQIQNYIISHLKVQ